MAHSDSVPRELIERRAVNVSSARWFRYVNAQKVARHPWLYGSLWIPNDRSSDNACLTRICARSDFWRATFAPTWQSIVRLVWNGRACATLNDDDEPR